MAIKPKVGMYLLDKQYKDTIYRIDRKIPPTVTEVYLEEFWAVNPKYGKDDLGAWFTEEQINEFFIEVKLTKAVKVLYGKKE